LRNPSLKSRSVYLELNNFEYFHGPSQIDHVDSRFIGRTALTEKLRSILTNSQTDTGAYLVTGYRGMGKSSLVAKVLHDLTSYQSLFRRASRYARVYFPGFVIALYHWNWTEHPFFNAALLIFLSVLTVQLLVHLRQHSRHHQDLGGNVPASWLRLLLDLIKVHDPVSARRGRMLMEDAVVILLLQAASVLVLMLSVGRDLPDMFWNSPQPFDYSAKVTAYTMAFVVLFVVNFARATYRRTIAPASMAHNFAAHSSQVHIRINLGYDALSELDILRLIARNLQSHYYRTQRLLSFRQWPWTIAKVGAGSLIVLLFYTYQPLHTNHVLLRTQAVEALEAWPRVYSSLKVLDDIAQNTFNAILEVTPFVSQISKVKVSLSSFVGPTLNLNDHLRPGGVDYLFLFYFFMGWLFVAQASSRGWMPFVTHAMVLRRLTRLNEQIDSQVTEESEATPGETGRHLPFFLRHAKARAYPRATERDIEKELIEILEDVGRIPRITLRPEFIFIFDEVDKIEPRDSPDVTPGPSDATLGHTDALRDRQRRVQRLLSNLKFLLTTARAKFIFIAGRELFDAALADVSDRNFFMGSIFNDVVYVDSFLKDRVAGLDQIANEKQPHWLRTIGRQTGNRIAHFVESRVGPRWVPTWASQLSARQVATPNAEITRLVTTFVCRMLLPLDSPRHTLEAVADYVHWLNRPTDANRDNRQTPEQRLRDEMEIVSTVNNFITYLAYRSNGAPKKLATLFERYVTSVPRAVLTNETESLVSGRHSSNLFLKFTPLDQYTFAVGAYLITPVFLSLDRALGQFGDKLLVSAAFIVDHLYKFHRTGLAWRNIELTPEILDINKAPHLRELITTIMRFLTQSHLREIDNGLYNFKFRRRIADEIRILSKLDEREAAAFNFTLDESLAIKRHYRRQLEALTASYTPHFAADRPPDFVRSISFLHMILGDLHFYDDEFDNAIVEYMEAIQLFGDGKVDNLTFDLMIVFVRNTLKLGLAFERRRTFDSAYMTYGKLVSRITKWRLTSLPVTEPPQDAAVLEQYDAFRQTVMQSLRLMYQPSMAKFQLTERIVPGGISTADLVRLHREVRVVLGANPPVLAEVDYHKRVGDILFYKNRSSIDVRGGANEIYCYEPGARCAKNTQIDEVLKAGADTPCGACRAYMNAFMLALGTLSESSGTPTQTILVVDALAHVLSRLDRERTERLHSDPEADSHLRALASLTSNLADTFLSCTGPREQLDPAFVKLLARLVGPGSGLRHARRLRWYYRTRELGKLEEAILHCFLSGCLFRRAGDSRSGAWQFTKLLYILRDAMKPARPGPTVVLAEAALKVAGTLAARIRHNLDSVHDNSYWLERQRLSAIVRRQLKTMLTDDWRRYPPPEELRLRLEATGLAGDALPKVETFLIEAVLLNTPRTAGISPGGVEVDLGLVDECYRSSYAEARVWTRAVIEKAGRDALANWIASCGRDISPDWDGWEVDYLHADLRDMAQTAGEEAAAKTADRYNRPSAVTEAPRLAPLVPGGAYNRVVQLNVHSRQALKRLRTTVDRLRSVESALQKRGRSVPQIDQDPTMIMLRAERLDAARDCVCDGTELLRHTRISGISYTINHSIIASTHERLGDCLSLLGPPTTRELLEQLDNHVGPVDIDELRAPAYHWSLALRHYRKALDAHRGGPSYHQLIQDMVYLNDDFNDDLHHFCAAQERFWLNRDGGGHLHVYKKMDRLKTNLQQAGAVTNEEDAPTLTESGQPVSTAMTSHGATRR
jgi:hypothetical protein